MGLSWPIRLRRTKPIGAIAVATVLVTLVFVLGRYWPIGPDYFFTLRPAAEAWFAGESMLYGQSHFGYYAAPWGILPIGPTVLLPVQYGQAVITTLSLAGVLFSVSVFGSDQDPLRLRVVAATLAIGNLHTFDMLIRGNIDAVPVTGIAFGLLGIRRKNPYLVGIGLWLLSVKPINVLLVAGVVVWLTRGWTRRAILTYLAPLGATFLISLPLFGFDWLLRYVKFVVSSPPLTYLQTTLWRAFELIGLDGRFVIAVAVLIILLFVVALTRVPKVTEEWPFALSASTNLSITPYALGSHFVLLAPAFRLLAGKSRWFLLLWLLTLTPLLRLAAGGESFELAALDIVYPLVVMMACFWVYLRAALTSPCRHRANGGDGTG